MFELTAEINQEEGVTESGGRGAGPAPRSYRVKKNRGVWVLISMLYLIYLQSVVIFKAILFHGCDYSQKIS